VSLVRELEWDSSFFGMPIGRLRDGLAAEDVPIAVREADARQYRCVYLLAPAGDSCLIDAAQANGFMLRDVRVELQQPVLGHPADMAGLRPGGMDDFQQLAPIALERFRNTRFFTDTNFPHKRSAELYLEWLRNGLTTDPKRKTLVSLDGHGFVVCRLDPSSSGGSIELIGVAEHAAGRGVGSTLIAGAGTLFALASLMTATVVTQGHNIAAQRLYQRNGYRTSAMSLWLHRWST
jgi:dTDP-4-amino-4,6-dideoxy-D-galactose acyltransferase